MQRIFDAASPAHFPPAIRFHAFHKKLLECLAAGELHLQDAFQDPFFSMSPPPPPAHSSVCYEAAQKCAFAYESSLLHASLWTVAALHTFMQQVHNACNCELFLMAVKRLLKHDLATFAPVVQSVILPQCVQRIRGLTRVTPLLLRVLQIAHILLLNCAFCDDDDDDETRNITPRVDALAVGRLYAELQTIPVVARCRRVSKRQPQDAFYFVRIAGKPRLFDDAVKLQVGRIALLNDVLHGALWPATHSRFAAPNEAGIRRLFLLMAQDAAHLSKLLLFGEKTQQHALASGIFYCWLRSVDFSAENIVDWLMCEGTAGVCFLEFLLRFLRRFGDENNTGIGSKRNRSSSKSKNSRSSKDRALFGKMLQKLHAKLRRYEAKRLFPYGLRPLLNAVKRASFTKESACAPAAASPRPLSPSTTSRKWHVT